MPAAAVDFTALGARLAWRPGRGAPGQTPSFARRPGEARPAVAALAAGSIELFGA